MTIKQKQELIAEVVALLQAKLEADTVQPAPVQNAPQKVEMLTIKECTEEIKGLSEHKADARREVRGYKGIKTHYVSFLQ